MRPVVVIEDQKEEDPKNNDTDKVAEDVVQPTKRRSSSNNRTHQHRNNNNTDSKTYAIDKHSLIAAEVVSYAPEYRIFQQPLFWVQLIEWFWFVGYFIVFAIVALGTRDWFNNWLALLIYMIGTVLVVLVAQLFSLLYYFGAHTRSIELNAISNLFAIPQSSTHTGARSAVRSNYMGSAHAKELVLAVMVTFWLSIASAAIWYDWLNRYKQTDDFISDASLTQVNIPNAANDYIMEFSTYQTMLSLLMLFQIISVLHLTRALWAHIKPLRIVSFLTASEMDGLG